MALLNIGAGAAYVVRTPAKGCQYQRRPVWSASVGRFVDCLAHVSGVFGNVFLHLVTGHQVSQSNETENRK